MSNVNYKQIISEGLWKNNPGLVQLLGLCPLMAVTTNTVNGLGLGIATIIALVSSSTAVSIIRHFITHEIRLPVFVLIIASNVTIIELLMQAYFYELYTVLGIFIPLIVTNCIIIGRAEAFAAKHDPISAFMDALMMGIGFALVLIVLGGLREFIAQATLFDQAHLMFGESARQFTLTFSKDYQGFLLAALPPGAFLGLGLMLAIKNGIDQQLDQQLAKRTAALKSSSHDQNEATS